MDKNDKLKLFLFLQTSQLLENDILAKQKVLKLLDILLTDQQNMSATPKVKYFFWN